MRKRKNHPAKWIIELEEELRGTYLRIAVDIEWMLLIVIHECLKPKISDVKKYYTFTNGKKKDINDLTLDEKINLAELLIKTKRPTFFNRHKTLFRVVHRLRGFRNKFAHCKIDEVDHDRTTVLLSTLQKGFKVEQKPYKIKSLKSSLRKYEKRIGETLFLMVSVLRITNPSALSNIKSI